MDVKKHPERHTSAEDWETCDSECHNELVTSIIYGVSPSKRDSEYSIKFYELEQLLNSSLSLSRFLTPSYPLFPSPSPILYITPAYFEQIRNFKQKSGSDCISAFWDWLCQLYNERRDVIWTDNWVFWRYHLEITTKETDFSRICYVPYQNTDSEIICISRWQKLSIVSVFRYRDYDCSE